MSVKPIAMRDAGLERIWKAMSSRKDIQFVTADFGSPILDKIRADFPDQFLNVGIAEQNLINVSVGLALEGYTVFAYAIAPFITMRCYEQIRVNIALLSTVRPMNINLIGVGAGYSYVVSGPTHQCYEDISIMRTLPGMQVFSPADHRCTEAIFDQSMNDKRPKYIRLDAQVLPVVYENGLPNMKQGFQVHRSGNRICFIATGYMVHTALQAAKELEKEGQSVGVVDLWDLCFFDAHEFQTCLSGYDGYISLEEGFKGKGGMDSMIFDLLAQNKRPSHLINLGIDGGYRFDLSSRQELHEQVGIGIKSLVEKAKQLCSSLR